jgi:hypothetical protein
MGETYWKQSVAPCGEGVHFELTNHCFRLCGRVCLSECSDLCTKAGTVVKVVVALPAEGLPHTHVNKSCTVGLWTCCAREVESSPFSHCGISNSGDVRVERVVEYREDRCAAFYICIVNNFDRRLFKFDNEHQQVAFNSVDYRLDQLQFEICGKLQDEEDCPVPQ